MSSVVVAISVPTFLKIDTIESLARKQGRLETIKNDFFTLEKITPSSRVSTHLKDEIQTEALSGVYATNAHFFGFAILNAKGTDYKKARFIAFGLANCKRKLNDETMEKLRRIFEICPPSSVDFAYDSPTKPNLDALALFGVVTRVKGSQTRYLNAPDLYGIDRVIIYDKALKEGFEAPLWRVEFRCPILQKLKHYEPPIDEMERVISALYESNALAKTANNPKLAQKGGKQ